MCGINGIIGLSDSIKAQEYLKKMNNSIAHRGPDDAGIYQNKAVHFGHRRLSIIDLSKAGSQPMITKNKELALTYNGEIYNFDALKKEYKTYPYHSNTDSEVILAAYQQDGLKSLNKFNGMWAFAIHDTTENKVILSRDRMGIKPLYYYFKDNILAFSSELTALLKLDFIDKKIEFDSLVEYLSHQTVHGTNTIIQSIKMLPPGCNAIFKNGELTIKKYWDVREKAASTIKTNNVDAKEEVKRLFDESVKQRMVSDVPFGAFLSGGIDSSAVVAMASKYSKNPLKTFNISFADKKFSEAKYAQIIADMYETDHTEIKLKPEEFVKHLPNAMDAMDHPSGDGPNSYIVSMATKKAGVSMALSGLGGDELFCGYSIFDQSLKLREYQKYNKIPQWARMFLSGFLKAYKSTNAGMKMAEVFSLKNINPYDAYPFFRRIYNPVDFYAFFGKDIQPQPDANGLLKLSDEKLLSAISVAEIERYMQPVLLRDTDAMSMAHSLEVRVPFLDHNLVEFALSLPNDIKMGYGAKPLLTDALKDLIPSEITDRPKMGFTLPWEDWLKKDIRTIVDESLEYLENTGMFKKNSLKDKWRSFMRGSYIYTWSRIWPLVALGHWMKKNGVKY